jgi:serine phosphatase RsbU (regulator of sigma subunit)
VTAAGASLLTLPRHPALGLRHAAPLHPTSIELRPDSTLLLYTDGLIERRDVGTDERLAALVASAAAHRDEPPDQLCTTLCDELRDERREDDATVLALRLHAR